jgi:hypothetical protein
MLNIKITIFLRYTDCTLHFANDTSFTLKCKQKFHSTNKNSITFLLGFTIKLLAFFYITVSFQQLNMI